MNSDSFNPNITGFRQSEQHRQAEAQRQAEQQRNRSTGERVATFFANRHTPLVAGVAFMMLGVFLLLSFISFFTAGVADQSMVQSNGVIENARNVSALHNVGGSIGAALSQLLIADGVGVAAFILVIWCFTIGVRLLRKNSKVHFYSFSLVSLFSIFTLSLVVGAATFDVKFSFFHLGGALGYYVNCALLNLAGVPGMIAVNIIVVMFWILACYKTLNGLYLRTRRVYQEHRKRFNGEVIPDDDQSDLSPFIGEQQVAAPISAADPTDNNTDNTDNSAN